MCLSSKNSWHAFAWAVFFSPFFVAGCWCKFAFFPSFRLSFLRPMVQERAHTTIVGEVLVLQSSRKLKIGKILWLFYETNSDRVWSLCVGVSRKHAVRFWRKTNVFRWFQVFKPPKVWYSDSTWFRKFHKCLLRSCGSGGSYYLENQFALWANSGLPVKLFIHHLQRLSLPIHLADYALRPYGAPLQIMPYFSEK